MDWDSMEYDTIHFDGSCKPNAKGRMGYGWIITWKDHNRHIHGRSDTGPHPANSNNVAEYFGLIRALEIYIKKGGNGPLEIYGDSKIVINQVRKRFLNDKKGWDCLNTNLQILLEYTLSLLNNIDGHIDIKWIPRSRNEQADNLASCKYKRPKKRNRKYLIHIDDSHVPDNVKMDIISLNKNKYPSYNDFKLLSMKKKDHLDDKTIDDLLSYLHEKDKHALYSKIPKDKVKQKIAIKWALRGLELSMAIYKAQIDTDAYKLNKFNNSKKFPYL